MRTSSVARRFARALLDIGVESAAYEAYGKELRTAVAVFSGAPDLYKVLLNPMYKLEQRKALTAKVSESLALSAPVSRLLDLLVDSRRIKMLEAVAEAYSHLEDEHAGRLRATVESPAPLEEKLLAGIKDKIAGATGKEVLLTHKSNPALIGGLVIRMDNLILDGSVKTQLELMKEKILEGVV